MRAVRSASDRSNGLARGIARRWGYAVVVCCLVACSFDVTGDPPPDPRTGDNAGEQADASGEWRACEADTQCGEAVCGDATECAGFEDTCGNEGTQERDCMIPYCDQGTCAMRVQTEVTACVRDTDGAECGAKTCTAFSECVAPGNLCATEGTRGRTCLASACAGGACVTSGQVVESEACERETDGKLCYVGQSCDPQCHTEYFYCWAGECQANDAP